MSAFATEATSAGVVWDAVRIPEAIGIALYEQLAADSQTAHRLGPIVISARSRATYWLIPTGSGSPDWLPGCRLLSSGSVLVLPAPTLDRRTARWLHRPEHPEQLTPAVWLAAALNDYALEAAP